MNNTDHLLSKIFTRKALVESVEQWRSEGQKIVFTNGCFDILHKGHVDYLNKAADYGDRLIIGLNSDNSVTKLKGSHRPIQDESSRLWILASLTCVSGVSIFDEETPIALINLIKPDVLVKGGDYTIETIVGSDLVIEQGGRVEVIPFLEGYSTSRLEDRILRSDDDPRR
jgi:D-glycero-beta-D-manno-heptose 1-phosphate adenylyltransferase